MVLHALLTGHQQQPYLSHLSQTKKCMEIRKIQKEVEGVSERLKKEGISEEEREWLKTEEKRLMGQVEEMQRHSVH